MDAVEHQHTSRRIEGRRLGEERSEEEVTTFNGMIHDDSSIKSRCYRCREELGKIIVDPTKRICADCQGTIDRSLARFYAKAAVKKAIKRAKARSKKREGRSN
jgi:predicted metal-dependent phosphoesterase TrpH